MNLKKTVAINLRYFRYKEGKSQEEYYTEHGLSTKYCASIEQGKVNPTLETIEMIANSLNLHPNDLILFNKNHIILKKRIDEKIKE